MEEKEKSMQDKLIENSENAINYWKTEYKVMNLKHYVN